MSLWLTGDDESAGIFVGAQRRICCPQLRLNVDTSRFIKWGGRQCSAGRPARQDNANPYLTPRLTALHADAMVGAGCRPMPIIAGNGSMSNPLADSNELLAGLVRRAPGHDERLIPSLSAAPPLLVGDFARPDHHRA